jgi:pSer/pThr/pTyr-binding forkhead associated (FHA) protein
VTAESGPLANLRFAVTRPLVLGRALECDLAIVSPHVSRQHARLDLDGEQLVVEDLGSSNGTLVNGVRLTGRKVLLHDDELRFHDIVFRVKENFSSPRREIASMNKTTFIENTAHIHPLGDKPD